MVKNPNIFQIGIKIATKNRLEKLRHSGQSWDGVIDEMLNERDKFQALKDLPIQPRGENK
jgi:hypothetical protein